MKRKPREDFVTIPLSPRYEFRHRTKQITLRVDRGKICATLPHLLWQLHGRIINKKRPIPVVINKGTRSMRFDSLKQCSTWLAECHGLKYGATWMKLVRGAKIIGDWDINYCYRGEKMLDEQTRAEIREIVREEMGRACWSDLASRYPQLVKALRAKFPCLVPHTCSEPRKNHCEIERGKKIAENLVIDSSTCIKFFQELREAIADSEPTQR